MNKFWRLLFAFFVLGVGEPDPDPKAAPADDPDALEIDPQPDPEPDPDPQPDPEPDDPVKLRAQLAAEKKAREDAEGRATTEARLREEAQRRQSQGGQPLTADQRRHEDEERKLSDPKTTELEKWQITSNREIRATRANSAETLFRAQDLADKTTFGQLAVTKPGLFKKYEKRVEDELARLRGLGQNANREGIMSFMIGQDALKGEYKKKAAPAAEPGKTVDRGKSSGARSDVRAGGAMTDRQKRAKRLEGQIL